MDRSNEQFYKYFDSKGTIVTLLTKNLRFSSPKLFNDPHDFKFLHVPPMDADETRQIIAENFANLIKAGIVPPLIQQASMKDGMTVGDPNKVTLDKAELMALIRGDGTDLPNLHNMQFQKTVERTNAFLNELAEDHFVYCLNKNPAEPLMWAHYADKHRGAVLRFEAIPELDNVFLIAKEVNYSQEPPSYGTREEWLRFFLEGVPLDHNRIYEQRTTAKSEHWKYEGEWRIVIPAPERKGMDFLYVPFRKQELTGIYLGRHMPENEVVTIIKLRNMINPETPIFREIAGRTGYGIDFEEMLMK